MTITFTAIPRTKRYTDLPALNPTPDNPSKHEHGTGIVPHYSIKFFSPAATESPKSPLTRSSAFAKGLNKLGRSPLEF
ncbi:MAG: hypothetical protein A3E87_00955 [Gammaproteobacteria bacterium RIFCSPHIGHO2_12_FULL_35_23]|nr:MAG: hypothetical protein A3E87_00955 [Gammaproteobacteria bacterium RIFCSPHIGHO2_12_FULL_35_23]